MEGRVAADRRVANLQKEQRKRKRSPALGERRLDSRRDRGRPLKELERLLAKVDIFRPLPPAEVERIALLSSSMRLEVGEALALSKDREVPELEPGTLSLALVL